MNKGKLIIYSGPSGAGKGTLRETFINIPEFKISFSISWTTRKIRPMEVNGIDYHFVTKEQFQKAIKNDEFLEWEEYAGNFYGTPLKPVLKSLERGKNILLEIEVKGQKQVISKMPNAISIFISPPSIEELRRRLSLRNTEDELILEERINIAKMEIEDAKSSKLYKHFIINNDLEITKQELLSILRKELN